MSYNAEEVAYRARALAQAHPLTPLAKRYLDRIVAEQRTSQPLPEIGIWAGAAILGGYCVRRVEEGEAGIAGLSPPATLGVGAEGGADGAKGAHGDEGSSVGGAEGVAGADGGGAPGAGRAPGSRSEEIDALDKAATAIAAKLRTGEPGPHVLGDEDRTVDSLDRIIASEVKRRLDHWRDSIDEHAWEELEEYMAWWVIKGYSLRAAEAAAWAPGASEAPGWSPRSETAAAGTAGSAGSGAAVVPDGGVEP